MMKRKIIKLGTSTLVISLPSKWSKRFNLRQGDELEVDERDRELVFATERVAQESKKIIDITELDTKLVERFIMGSYIQGYDEIRLDFNKTEIMDLKAKKPVPTINFIQSIVNNLLISMEIIEQKEDYCILKDLSQMSSGTFEPVLRRLFLMLKGMSHDALTYAQGYDKEKMKNIGPIKDNLHRFVNYSLRLLNKKAITENNKSAQYYAIIYGIKMVSDALHYISIEFNERKRSPSKEAMAGFSEAVNSIDLFYSLFYKFDHDTALGLVKSRRKAFESINAVQEKQNVEDILLVGRLSFILVQLLNMLEIRVSVEM